MEGFHQASCLSFEGVGTSTYACAGDTGIGMEAHHSLPGFDRVQNAIHMALEAGLEAGPRTPATQENEDWIAEFSQSFNSFLFQTT